VTQLVYDSGALIAVERNDRLTVALHKRALQRRQPPVVSTAVIAETAYHSMPNLAWLLDGCEIEPLTTEAATTAGQLRHRAKATVVDAIVVEQALRLPNTLVVTSDRDDLTAIANAAGHKLNIRDV